MPTGYTAEIADGISFEKFVLRCARAFGALIDMRDDPMDAEIPDEFKPSDYHQKKLETARVELAEAKSITLEDAAVKAEQNYRKELEQHEKYLADKKELKTKYTAMLQLVKEWQPPTPDHAELKNFMVQQITESINFDCNTSYNKPPKLHIAHEWLDQKINECLESVAYHSTELEKEIERCNCRTAWVKALKQSLK